MFKIVRTQSKRKPDNSLLVVRVWAPVVLPFSTRYGLSILPRKTPQLDRQTKKGLLWVDVRPTLRCKLAGRKGGSICCVECAGVVTNVRCAVLSQELRFIAASCPLIQPAETFILFTLTGEQQLCYISNFWFPAKETRSSSPPVSEHEAAALLLTAPYRPSEEWHKHYI